MTGLIIWFKLDSNRRFFIPCDLRNLMDYLKKIIGHLFYTTSSILHQALCIILKPSVNSNWSYSPEMLNSSQIGNFLSRLTFKFYGWPWKTIGHLFYATLSFVHFKAIGKFNLKLQYGNAQYGSKSVILLSCVTLKFDDWSWKTIGPNNWVKINNFFSRVTLKFDGWP